MTSLPKKVTPRQRWLEELRRQADAELERMVNEPLSEKAKQDQATLEALDATKH
jgi:hypothetical protein